MRLGLLTDQIQSYLWELILVYHSTCIIHVNSIYFNIYCKIFFYTPCYLYYLIISELR